jgi:1,4-alpha-glucan branching enzyme
MPGDDWQRFANLRLILGYLYTHPGKKLIFMGGEFGQWREWHHDESLDWHLREYAPHQGVSRLVADLNRIYRTEGALHVHDTDPVGFEWIDCSDWEKSVVSFLRRGRQEDRTMLVVCNFTPVVRRHYRVGVPSEGVWREVLNSDADVYGGSGQGNCGRIDSDPIPIHGRDHSIAITLPPLALTIFTHEEHPR